MWFGGMGDCVVGWREKCDDLVGGSLAKNALFGGENGWKFWRFCLFVSFPSPFLVDVVFSFWFCFRVLN